jgi:sugar O-acyltransferase (sialic acid O-acetyltransferase NeuD family)
MTTRAVIIGAGGFGREVRDWLLQSGGDFLGFLDDGEPDAARLDRLGARHLGGTDELAHLDAVYYIGVGDPGTGAKIDARARDLGATAGPAIVHPSAIVGSDVQFGDGTVVCPGVLITTNIRIGRHVHLNIGSTVGHDTVIEDYVTVNPGATISGDCHLDSMSTVGTNAAVRQGVKIGASSTLGAGAAAVKDVAAGEVWVGVPARALTRG